MGEADDTTQSEVKFDYLWQQITDKNYCTFSNSHKKGVC